MATAVQMVNPTTGEVVTGYRGFSWTCFFFGPFPALFRGHFIGFLVMLVLAIPTMGLSWLVFIFSYNGWYYNRLVKIGFVPQFGGVGIPQQNIVNVHVGNNTMQDNAGHGLQAMPVPTPTGQVSARGTSELDRPLQQIDVTPDNKNNP